MSAGLTASLQLMTELVILAVFMIALNFSPSPTIIYLIPIFVLELILIMGIALPLSVLNAKFKDVEFIWGVVLQAGFFLTPIIYQLVGGLKASMGYTGSKDISDFKKNVKFVQITSAGLRESHVHDVDITRESPNYPTNV